MEHHSTPLTPNSVELELHVGENDVMSIHEMMMGQPGQMKAQAFERLVAHYLSHGWAVDDSSDAVIAFEPPADATPEQIGLVERGAAAILAVYGLGVG